ncbi:MAG: outer membrane beta-barrel protein [Candidatus Korobacteraceae bacterium]
MRLTVFCLLFLPLFTSPALAQFEQPRLEAGVHFTTVDISGLGEKPVGGGGRLTLRMSRLVALEGEVNRFPIGGATANFPMTQVLAGLRIGGRIGPFGIFGKVRPGYTRFDASSYDHQFGRRANLDLGAVISLYSSRHFGVRFDFGNTLIFFGNKPVQSPAGVSLGTRSNFQGGAGVFVHF